MEERKLVVKGSGWSISEGWGGLTLTIHRPFARLSTSSVQGDQLDVVLPPDFVLEVLRNKRALREYVPQEPDRPQPTAVPDHEGGR